MVAARLAYRRHAPCPDRARHHADRPENIQCAPLEVLAGDVFEGLPARPKIHPVSHLGVAGDGADSGIDEVRHQARYGVTGDDRVGVDANEKLRIVDVFDAIVEGFGLARVRFRKDKNPSRSLFPGEAGAGHFERAVLGAVIDHDHPQVRVVRVECGAYRSLNHFFFVVGRNKYRDLRPIRCDFCRLAEDFFLQAVIDRRRTDK